MLASGSLINRGFRFRYLPAQRTPSTLLHTRCNRELCFTIMRQFEVSPGLLAATASRSSLTARRLPIGAPNHEAVAAYD